MDLNLGGAEQLRLQSSFHMKVPFGAPMKERIDNLKELIGNRE